MRRIQYTRHYKNINEEDVLDAPEKSYVEIENFHMGSLNDIEPQIIDLIKELEGYCIRLREIHWSAEHKSLHELTDTIISELCEFIDEIAEECMGLTNKRFSIKTFEAVLPEDLNISSLLTNLYNELLSVRNSIDKTSQAPGMVSTFDDMLKQITKYSYLATFA